MRKIRLEIMIPAAFLLVVAFVIGFTVQDVVASNGNPVRYVQSLGQLPERLENAVGTSVVEEACTLPLIETYSSVMERLNADYYGKPIDETKLTYEAIRGTLHALGDPFTRFIPPDEYKKMREENEGNFTGIGAQLDTNKKGEVYIKEPLPDTPAEKAGVKKNDVITAVNDKVIAGIDIEDVVKMIRGPEGTKVKLTLRRHGVTKPVVKTIIRRVVEFRMVTFRMLDKKNGIGYIRLYQFNEKSDEQFNSALSALEKVNLKGLVLDLRGNPGGLLQVAVDIGSRLIESGPVVIIQERGGQKQPAYVKEDKHNHKRYPLVVLVDKHSASASEIVSGAIKDTHAGTLVGVKTFGKGRVQTIIPLSDGSAVAITTAKYLTPNGTDIHTKGIEPDVVVAQPDWEGFILSEGKEIPPEWKDILKSEGKKTADEIDFSDPKYDLQLTNAIDVVKVKMGLLPESVLEKLKKSASADKPKKATSEPRVHNAPGKLNSP